MHLHIIKDVISNERMIRIKEETKLARIRKSKGLTQAALASKSGLNTSAIGAFECGMRNIHTASVKTLKRLADALDVRTEELL